MVKRERVEKMIPLRLQGMPHEEIRLRIGVSVGNYSRAKRLLNTAVALSVASPVPLTITEALEEAADLYVVRSIRLGELRHAGFGRRECQERLGCTDEEYEAADEWLRDVQAELSQGQADAA